MPKIKSSSPGRRVWSMVRVVQLWARKGGVFRRRLMFKLLKNIERLSGTPRRDQIGYMGERELSFNKTPMVHVRMHRPYSVRFLMSLIPCINTQIDFDYDFDGDDIGGGYGYESCDDARKGFIEGFEYEEDDETEEGEGIDVRAEEFIAKFYEQMKLQRQISYLQYNQ